MNKNLLLAGVSAAALVLSASSAFAIFDSNGNTSNGGTDATTNSAANFSHVTNSTGNSSTTDNSNNSGQDNGNGNNALQNADISLNKGNEGTIGNNNTSANAEFHAFTLNDNESLNEKNTADFSGNDGAVTASTLGGVIAASSVDFTPASGVNYDGNLVDGTFAGAAGIAGVNQNNAINANNQQSVSVASGAVTVNTVR